jgi:AbrB family transcriptional regulator, transcriptional pleiotropic regulator of transition state genes
MKVTGIVRRIDELGRIVLPIEWRWTFGIREKDPLEISVDGEKIVLQKYSPVCVFCGFPGEVTLFKGKPICRHCKDELRATTVCGQV